MSQTRRPGKRSYFRISCIIWALLMISPLLYAEETKKEIPKYVLDGLNDYKTKGYEAAVRTWLKDSPFEKATEMASRIQYFKNIEMLYGKYINYKVIAIQEPGTAHMIYIQLDYERKSVFLQFTSFKQKGKWVLSNIKIDEQQRIPGNLTYDLGKIVCRCLQQQMVMVIHQTICVNNGIIS